MWYPATGRPRSARLRPRELRPNEAKRVEITLDPRSFQYWDEVAHAWTFLGGERTIWVGDSSRDLRLSGTVSPQAQ
jgi:mannose-6-phosphate isomerase-like protein (cupin superfamily)